MKTEDIKNFYNDTLSGGKAFEYEFDRWHKTDQRQAGFDMTKSVIEEFVSSHNLFHSYLEVGPGPGTWTELFVKKNPKASFDLVDISREMLLATRERFRSYKNINFFESDFLKFDKNGYDMFFSSRAFEYFPDKVELVKKIKQVLKIGGNGFIITKTPHTLRRIFFHPKSSQVHRSQISPSNFKRIFEAQGLKVEKIKPVTFVFPVLKSGKLDRLLFKIFSRLPFNPLSYFFSESYAMHFKKYDN